MKKKERASAEKREERNSWRFEERSGVLRVSQVALVVKNPSINAGDIRDADLIPGSGRSQGEEMAPYSNVLAWRIP